MSEFGQVSPSSLVWQLPGRQLSLDAGPLLMGIVNVTPDSFSDGGRYFETRRAVEQGLKLIEQGADILDIGGESTRPGSLPVPLEEELRRVVPVVEELAKQTTITLSIDTSKAEVARQCLGHGAHIINDVTALRGDADMAEVARQTGAGVVLMHMQGVPQSMQENPQYEDVVGDVARFFQERLQQIDSGGIDRRCLVLDPGIGFGKTSEHNLQLLAQLDQFSAFGLPICLGVSRKGLVGKVLAKSVELRLMGSLAVVCHAVVRNTAHILRVHDVAETRDVVTMLQAIFRFEFPSRKN